MNSAMVLPGVKLCKAIPVRRNMHKLPKALWCSAVRMYLLLTSALLVTHHTVSLFIKENWNMYSFKLSQARSWFCIGVNWRLIIFW